MLLDLYVVLSNNVLSFLKSLYKWYTCRYSITKNKFCNRISEKVHYILLAVSFKKMSNFVDIAPCIQTVQSSVVAALQDANSGRTNFLTIIIVKIIIINLFKRRCLYMSHLKFYEFNFPSRSSLLGIKDLGKLLFSLEH